MTTIVTVRTNDWPVAVSINHNHSTNTAELISYGYTSRTEFMPANSERSYAVTEAMSVTFTELPLGATDLSSVNNTGVQVAPVTASDATSTED